MYHQVFFGATCAGILLAAGLLPLPDRDALPDFTLPQVELSEMSLPNGADLLSNIGSFVDDLPELGQQIEETVIRPSLTKISSVARNEPQPTAPAALPVISAEPRVTTASTVNFELDAKDLDLAAKEQLDVFAAWLKTDETARLGIFGHTDLTGSPDYNKALGLERAEQVAAYLQSVGVPADRIEIIKSYGETAPVIATDAPSRDNRRVQIKVM